MMMMQVERHNAQTVESKALKYVCELKSVDKLALKVKKVMVVLLNYHGDTAVASGIKGSNRRNAVY
jgi:hypothetical protein